MLQICPVFSMNSNARGILRAESDGDVHEVKICDVIIIIIIIIYSTAPITLPLALSCFISL